MTTKPRFVIDTNTFISALLNVQSVPRRALAKARSGGQLLQSDSTIQELNEVVKRKKFDKYVTEQERLAFVEELLREVVVVEITVTITACRDPKDDKYLELAVSGNASCIVSGDKDLLALHPFREIPILAPADFLAREQADE
jgi:hypothetical protein